ncbi:MAG: two-component regulator propeller domain-containing protein, partial [Bacteroidota bacterium]
IYYRSVVYDIVQDQEDQLWLGTNAGLFQLQAQPSGDFRIKSYQYETGSSSGLSGNIPWDLDLGPEGDLWIAGYGSGVDRFRPSQNQWQHYAFSEQSQQGLNSQLLTEITVDQRGIVWIGTQDRGLNRLDPQTGKWTYFKHEAGNRNHIGSNYVLDIYEDRSGGLWVSTAGSGLNYCNPWRIKFEHYQQQASTPNSLSNNYVISLLKSQDPWQSLWIGTHGGGLNQMIYDPETQSPRFLHYEAQADKPSSLRDEVVLSLCEDETSTLWVGTFQGLSLLSPEARDQYVRGQVEQPRFSDPPFRADGFAERYFSALLRDRQGQIWMATDNGLYCYDPKQKRYRHFQHDPDDPHSLNHDHLLCLYEDHKGNLWIGSHNGLNIIPNGEMQTDRPQMQRFLANPDDPAALSYSQVYVVQQDEQDRIWVGTTGGGLNAFLEEANGKGSFRQYYKTDGLPSNNIEGILSDDDGFLWVATDAGLCRFQPDSLLSTASPNAHIKRYYAADGLQGGEFIEGAYTKGPDGRLYFGGVEGFNVFHPAQLQPNPHPPDVILTGLRILDKDIEVGDTRSNGDTILREQLAFAKELSLSYRDYGFTISFAALDYAAPEQNQFAYLLEGLDEKWIQTGNRPFASFTNLDAGTYRFRLKASNNDGLWQEMARPLLIHISPPPWASWWAFLLYGVAFCGVVYLYIRYKIREREREIETRTRIETAKAQERETVRKNTAADFHDELGNKMTKISLFVELAKRAGEEDLPVYLGRVEDNMQLLSQGIRDFIWVLDPEKDSLYDTLVRIKDFGDELYEHTEITFRTEGINERLLAVSLALDVRRHLVLLFQEVMNNSLKYAQASVVKFRLQPEGEVLHLSFADNGQGFDPKKIKAGYGLQNIRQRAKKIGAEVEIQTELGQGTRISLQLPLPQMGD